MSEKEEKHPFKVILEKYISEILVIFIGISISFFFDEWREGRRDDETIKKHLEFLRTNLVEDTLNLTSRIKHSSKLVNSINKLTYFRSDTEIKDSIHFHIDNAASYLFFKPNQMAYEEIRQTAHTNLIKNDSLKILFLSYYTSTIPYCTEWCKIDETHTMTQLIPEMSNYFPVVADSLKIISSQEITKALRLKKLRNLLLANAVYKKEGINSFITTKKIAIKLLKKVDNELQKD
ncbi:MULTISPECIES: hypothetical protein [unclassified Spirosoma]|uniref:hypothetical protein n=1 Tax=unclassified Spirosoma TaxID=2621999 RepID=UPI000965D3DE|nr:MULTISPECIES: hypothetical protein [unclassified Spirosoma]MBN8820936.1 hypothetical protein [Spirosoma sp.]OJW75947.1 MAG: hypothetical protein BGO59_03700 [Spirosoma sp. 48-14]